MLGWALVLGPFGILPYYFRWARVAFLLIVGAVFLAAGDRVGVAIGMALFLLAATPFLIIGLRSLRHHLPREHP